MRLVILVDEAVVKIPKSAPIHVIPWTDQVKQGDARISISGRVVSPTTSSSSDFGDPSNTNASTCTPGNPTLKRIPRSGYGWISISKIDLIAPMTDNDLPWFIGGKTQQPNLITGRKEWLELRPKG